jgi:amino acid adenylation domain-containing protein
VSFEALERVVVGVVERLVAAGVVAGVPVGVVGGVGLAQVVAALAVVRLGAVWVPVDVELPVGRAVEMVADAGVTVAVVSEAARAWWAQVDAAAAVTAVVVDDGGDVVDVVAGTGERPRVLADDAAWVLFTSGTTGRPKGVIGSLDGLRNRLSWWWRTIPYQPGDRAVVKTRPGFVDAISELLAPLLAGIPVVVADTNQANDPGRLAALLADEHVTHLVAVPSLLAVLYDTHHDVTARAPLRVITSSGEPLSTTLAATIRRTHPHATIVNLYGSTETSGDATAAIITADQPIDHITIGRPIDNVAARILDGHHQLLPPGASGHLHIGGAALTHGYLPSVDSDDHARFWHDDDHRWYDTGDLARWTPDGTLEHLGRHDRQTKIRGVRVEPAGIEHTLLTLDHVTDAAVTTRHHPTRGTELTAYLVLDNPHHPLDHIRHQLRTTLPTHHLPTHLIPTTHIPRTPTGKIDHHTLTTTTAGDSEPRVQPRTATEQMVAEVFAAVLGVGDVGAFDDFFGLGGHSLLATRTISELSTAFGVDVSIADLFSNPVVADLAGEMQTRVVRDSGGDGDG